jgi:hypothetical protein
MHVELGERWLLWAVTGETRHCCKRWRYTPTGERPMICLTLMGGAFGTSGEGGIRQVREQGGCVRRCHACHACKRMNSR